jgi:hypothetical protein
MPVAPRSALSFTVDAVVVVDSPIAEYETDRQRSLTAPYRTLASIRGQEPRSACTLPPSLVVTVLD